MKAKWYVYELADPATGEAFYIGCGSGRRIDTHGLPCDSHNSAKIDAIKRIGSENVIRRKIAEFWNHDAALMCEAERIHENAAQLTNVRLPPLGKPRRKNSFDVSGFINELPESFITGESFEINFTEDIDNVIKGEEVDISKMACIRTSMLSKILDKRMAKLKGVAQRAINGDEAAQNVVAMLVSKGVIA